MIKGKTKTGFAFELEEAVLDNMELVDALDEMKGDDPLALSAVVRMVLGPARGALYEHLRTEDGRVPVNAISQEIMDIFEALGKPGKN